MVDRQAIDVSHLLSCLLASPCSLLTVKHFAPYRMLQDPFETLVLFLSVLIVNQTLSDSKSNWLEGAFRPVTLLVSPRLTSSSCLLAEL